MSKLVVTPVSKRKFRTTQPYARNGIDVPVGFIFDGASIPRPLWFAFAPHEYLTSSVIHDYGYAMAIKAYKSENYALALEWFKRADTAFLAALKEDDRRVARLFYNAVHLWRWLRYPEARG
ncbi:MAG: DUF1353 domain-containing protein [Helicobacteraceae bacterium]|jgi:hypothetical protein|nr:DUF1353 domain-containing protein [Helicobacteraceae bacterium]